MAKKNEVTVEVKLRALFDLQLIDSRVDEIRNVRGELPLEVEDLENEIAGLEKRLENFNQEVSDFDFQTKEQKNNIEVAKEEFKKYEENLKNVRNNREYNSIVKEQEFQQLEIQLSEMGNDTEEPLLDLTHENNGTSNVSVGTSAIKCKNFLRSDKRSRATCVFSSSLFSNSPEAPTVDAERLLKFSDTLQQL